MTTLNFTEKQLLALQDIVSIYKELQREVHDYPEPENLFTKTQKEVFEILNVIE